MAGAVGQLCSGVGGLSLRMRLSGGAARGQAAGQARDPWAMPSPAGAEPCLGSPDQEFSYSVL